MSISSQTQNFVIICLNYIIICFYLISAKHFPQLICVVQQ